MRLLGGDEERLMKRMMNEIYSRHRVACWVAFALVVVALSVWGVGKKVPVFPADYRGVWRDERGVGVTIGATRIQWTDANGKPTKYWECERLHAWPGGVSFSLRGKDERMCIEWNAWRSSIQFGYHEELETGPSMSRMVWTPQSWQMTKVGTQNKTQ
jgi:hypothetical protein